MKFGRLDAAAIRKHMWGQGIGLHPDLGKPEDYIESMLSLLYGNESVIDYIPCPRILPTSLFLITDSGKLLCTEVTTTVTEKALWDKTDYFYAPKVFTLTSLCEEKTIVETRKEPGIFGSTKDNVIMFFDEGSIALSLKKGTGNEVYKAILAAKKKTMPKPPKAKPSTSKTASKSSDKPSPEKVEKPSSESDAIKEIRKMYEDGIIEKAEMMELLKAHLSK